MSSVNNSIEAAQAQMMCCCASCGIAEVDDVKLKPCDGCDLVSYCSDTCKEDHWPEHETSCKERAAEKRDEILFEQPESTHLGDCPICCLPLYPFNDREKTTLHSCCCKRICNGCFYANELRQWEENMILSCPFCRHPQPKTVEEFNKNIMKRVAVNDPAALGQLGLRHFYREEYDKTFEYYTKAAELGDMNAHFNLSVMYMQGQGVEKDETKKIFHLEEAAIGGHVYARHNLGCYEQRKGRNDRAVKHWTIAANLGHDPSMKSLKEYYKHGLVSKEDFAAALRAHQAAVDATKSPQREAAEKAQKWRLPSK